MIDNNTGNNIPQPGVPESFKVLVKELQALCLDVRVLDSEGNEIELKDDDEDDDLIPNFREEYTTTDEEIEASGYFIEDVPEDDYTMDEDDGEEE